MWAKNWTEGIVTIYPDSYVIAHEETQSMETKLTGDEKSLLKKIADSTDELLAKRAVIVLMLDSGSSVANIAKEVNLVPKTVQRWQKAFVQKRLGIFPGEALTGQLSPTNEVVTMVEEMEPHSAVAAPPKKKKAKKGALLEADDRSGQAVIEYPARDRIGLEATDSLAEAGRKVLSFHFGRMLTHEPGTRLGSDIEALHDMRVATRRMRAAFRVFGSGFKRKTIKPLLAGLRTTGRVLGRVRDLDVFMEKLRQYQQSLPQSEQAGLQPLLKVWSGQRKQARREMMVYLDSKKYVQFKHDFLKFVTTPGLGAKAITADSPAPYQLRHVAPGLIYERYEAVHAFEVVLPNASLDTLHQLRITYKSLRYTLEFLAEILGNKSRMVIGEVKTLQDHLGELNDARVASELVQDFLADWDERQQRLPRGQQQSRAPLMAYLESRLAERQRLLETFPQAWARFNQPDFRRNLALAIAVL
jgi:CHAD domain-containing protein/transposase-like protein